MNDILRGGLGQAKRCLGNANPSCRCSQDIIFLRGTSDNTFGSTTRILLALLTVQASRRATLRLGPNALDATIAQNCFYMWASQDVVIALFGSEKKFLCDNAGKIKQSIRKGVCAATVFTNRFTGERPRRTPVALAPSLCDAQHYCGSNHISAPPQECTTNILVQYSSLSVGPTNL